MEKIDKTSEDRLILINVENLSKTSAGGIHIPDTAEVAQKGTVFKTGPDCRQFSEGDVVILEKDSGLRVEIGEEKYTVVREGDVLFSIE